MKSPPKPESLSIAQARRLVLQAQGLDRDLPFGTGAQGVLRAFARLGYVQIDTISIIERAHHHVIWSRVPDYTPALLHRLQADKREIFEYWSHAASLLPMADYRYCLPRMHAYANGKRHWFAQDRKAMAHVLERIRAEGPLQSNDFEAPKGQRAGKWFEWKPAKTALEQLFTQGALMIRERRGFQKVFDLTERVLPTGVDTTMPSEDELATYLIRQALRSHAIALEPEMRYLRSLIKPNVMKRVLAELIESKEITRVRIEGEESDPRHGDAYALVQGLADPEPPPIPATHTRILSPFDNLVIQRKRMQRLFDFEYQIECYVPAPKRKHGYFVLPVLWADRLAARVDIKADRAAKTLRVLSLHVERPNERKEFWAAFQPELKRFATFNGCPEVVFLGK